MTTAEQREQVGTTILDQLASTSGGAGENRLRAMMDATDFKTCVAGAFTSDDVLQGSPGVAFRFRGCKKWNGIEIFLDEGNDTYNLRFYRMQLEDAGTVLTLNKWMKDIYADDLASLFTDNTGLDTHL